MMRRLTVAVMAGVLAACSPPAAPSKPDAAGQAVHPESGLAVIPLTVIHGEKRLAFRVELAATPAQQEKGLMFRTRMGADEGMLFPMDPPRGASFWMRNTVIPLDIVFIGSDRRIINIAAGAKPYDETPVNSDGLAAGVLELNGGRAAALGIAPGDRVEW